MSSSPFHAKIKTALADANLQAALDANAERRVLARAEAFASLPESLAVTRQRVHEMRSDVIANLDSYLEQFINQARENGLIIHRATNSDQARNVVLDIARQHDARLIAKSKTMVSEEINLNTALENEGISVVETDLGEYIVQLRDEHPSHIITPAVHLRRDDVGKTFQKELNIPYTEDIPTLTSAARSALRETFLQADIGLSGVNFGVAATGTMCLVTNEGNGRMVTSLPPVHIALMGIERIVPDMDALSLALSVLPRSATGQKITVYTQLINAPDPDNNPRERHLILVDNGRSNLRGSPLNDALLCIRCGACLNTCPIFREIGGHAYVGQHGQATTYPGPIGSVISPGLFGQSDFGHLAQACTVCGACKEACPANIDLPSMLLRVRANQRSGEQISMPIRGGLHIFRWFATNPWRFRLAQKLAALFSRIMSPKNNWMRLPSFTGWGYAKDFPRPAAKPFRVRFHSHQHTKQQSGEIQEPYHPQPQTVENLAPISKPELPADQRTLTEQFKDELFALDGTLIHCTAENLTTNILEFLGSQNITTITACEDSALPSGLANGLRQAGINIKHGLQPDVQVGLTGALAGVAETGTLAIPVSPGCPQETSLLPQIHLAVLYVDKINKNLAQVLALREVQLASSTALISGPSRTADIEMTLTLGMHGPGQLIVFCID